MVVYSDFIYDGISIEELLEHRQRLLGDELFGLYLLYNKELGIVIKQIDNNCFIVMENEGFDTKVVEDLLSRMFNLKDINQFKYFFILHILNEFIIPKNESITSVIYESLDKKNLNININLFPDEEILELLDSNIEFSPNDLLLPNYKELIEKYN